VRIRARFTKLGKVRFVSHRDLAQVWERALRRAELPVAYSGGFTSRPKVHFGLALSVGYESVAEYLDIDLDPGRLTEPFDPDRTAHRMSEALPAGMEVTAVAPIDSSAPSLQEQVTSTAWTITLDGPPPVAVAARVAEVLAAGELVVTRQRKGQDVTDDIRPNLRALHTREPGDAGGTALLDAELGTRPRAVRPAELLVALDPAWEAVRVFRSAQWIRDGDDRQEPLALSVPSLACATVRA
jgi:radical SAM-linked protein